MDRRLYKSQTNKVLFGVCGGLGEYFNIDPTIIRLILALLVLFAGTGILAYIVAALVIPKSPY
jgi:phage shock protein PspC (stress-responsive transcriptional regulator)